jgi:hypothetical protein
VHSAPIAQPKHASATRRFEATDCERLGRGGPSPNRCIPAHGGGGGGGGGKEGALGGGGRGEGEKVEFCVGVGKEQLGGVAAVGYHGRVEVEDRLGLTGLRESARYHLNASTGRWIM